MRSLLVFLLLSIILTFKLIFISSSLFILNIHINEIIQYVLGYFQIFAQIISIKFIYYIVSGSSFFKPQCIILLWTYHNSFIHSAIEEQHICCFQIFCIIDRALMTITINMFFCTYVFIFLWLYLEEKLLMGSVTLVYYTKECFCG